MSGGGQHIDLHSTPQRGDAFDAFDGLTGILFGFSGIKGFGWDRGTLCFIDESLQEI